MENYLLILVFHCNIEIDKFSQTVVFVVKRQRKRVEFIQFKNKESHLGELSGLKELKYMKVKLLNNHPLTI